VDRADAEAFSGRRQKKRQFRQLWITRISAACRQRGVMYSRFMNGLQKAGVQLNRKELAELAIASPDAFDELVAVAGEQA
jgi:large subunit ribosomal protein L20